MYSHYNMHTLLKWRITKTISYWHCSKYLRARSNMIRETYIPSRCRFQRSNIVSPQLRAFQGYNENTSNDNKDCCSRSINSLRNCWLFIKKMWCFIKKTYPCPPLQQRQPRRQMSKDTKLLLFPRPEEVATTVLRKGWQDLIGMSSKCGRTFFYQSIKIGKCIMPFFYRLIKICSSLWTFFFIDW